MSRAPSGPPPSTQWSWQAQLLRRQKGAPEPVFANALLVLQNDAEFSGCLRFNEFSLMAILERKLPDLDGVFPRIVTEHDISHVQAMLQRKGLTRLGRDAASRAIDYIAKQTPFHPIRDWLKSLTWDGVSRLTDWLQACLGVQPKDQKQLEYIQQVGTKFLIAMVARIMQPGCKADYTLVLEGPEGIMKSSVCRILAGSEYFSDHLPPLHSQPLRVSMHLRGKWLIEISELASLERANPEEVRSFLTRPVEQYVPLHGRHEAFEPRQCLFVGTTNHYEWSTDATGARRFWPIKPTNIELNKLEDAREQLFAEAFYLYQQGTPWHPDLSVETTYFTPQQAERYDEDPWTAIVQEYLEPRTHAYLETIATDDTGLRVPMERLSPTVKHRIAKILRRSGWKPSGNHGKRRAWVRI